MAAPMDHAVGPREAWEDGGFVGKRELAMVAIRRSVKNTRQAFAHRIRRRSAYDRAGAKQHGETVRSAGLRWTLLLPSWAFPERRDQPNDATAERQRGESQTPRPRSGVTSPPVLSGLSSQEPVVRRENARGDPRRRAADSSRRSGGTERLASTRSPEWTSEQWKRQVEAEARGRLKKDIRDPGKKR